jgi:hypothetical protein
MEPTSPAYIPYYKLNCPPRPEETYPRDIAGAIFAFIRPEPAISAVHRLDLPSRDGIDVYTKRAEDSGHIELY